MNGKIAALVAVAVFGLVCLAPAVSDEVSAEKYDIRISTVYIYQADFVITDTDAELYDFYTYLIDGSEKHAVMEAYLKDPRNAALPTGDDRSLLSAAENIGKTLHIYRVFSQDSGISLEYNYEWKDGVLRLSPYNVEDIFKGDVEDVVKLRINSITDSTGKKIEGAGTYVYPKGTSQTYNYIMIGTTVKFVVDKDTSFFIKPEWNSTSLCYNIDFDLEIQKPSGSATTFMAVCFVISAITIALLAFGALKPKWSK